MHGGGFAGTILAFVREEDIDGYSELLTLSFGSESVSIITIRSGGTMHLNNVM